MKDFIVDEDHNSDQEYGYDEKLYNDDSEELEVQAATCIFA